MPSDLSIPPLSSLKDVGIVALCLMFVIALGRGWLYVAAQVNKIIEGHKEVADTWKEVAQERQKTIELITESIDPVVRGNEAILRAIEEIQDRRNRNPSERRR